LIDILVVIDNSVSMGEEQRNLAAKLEYLFESIKEANWKMRIINTTGGDPCYRQEILSTDPVADRLAKFKAGLIHGPTANSSNEMGVKRAVEGLQCNGGGWLRNGSQIAILIVSDADNCTNRAGCGNAPWGKPAYLLDELAAMNRPIGAMSRVYAIISKPGVNCPTDERVGYDYQLLVDQTSGVSGSICASNYTNTLLAMSSNIATILKNDFNLSMDPNPGSVKVKVNGELYQASTDYSVYDRRISFHKVPPLAASIVVDYEVGGRSIVRDFPLKQAPADDETLVVKVNGEQVARSSFTIGSSGSKPAIIFNNPPPENATIDIDYREAKPLKTSFPLPAGTKVVPGSVAVTANTPPGMSYDPASNAIHFQTPPPDGSLFDVTYTRDEGPQLQYALTLEGASVRSLTFQDKDTGEPIAAHFKDGFITIPAESFRDQRKILVSYRNELIGSGNYQLPSNVIMDSFSIEGGGPNCRIGDGIIIEGRNVSWACDLQHDTELTVKYSLALVPISRFELPEYQILPTAIIAVTINGKPTTAYTIDRDNVLTLTTTPPEAAVVRVVVSYNVE
jgi:hypothetical protein